MSEGNVEAALREWENAIADVLDGHDRYGAQDGSDPVDRLIDAGATALAALRSRGSSDTRRRCRECGRDEDYAMEDGSWICEACGCVSSTDTRLTEALRDVIEHVEAGRFVQDRKQPKWLTDAKTVLEASREQTP